MWTCDTYGGPVKPMISVDGSDVCACRSCMQLEWVNAATGKADAIGDHLRDAIEFATSDPAYSRRLMELARSAASEAAARRYSYRWGSARIDSDLWQD